MLPISALTSPEARELEGLLFDLDDTLFTQGKLSEQAYASLFRLRDAGLRLIVVTGRPASWADLCARLWPVEAAIGENGALAYAFEAGRTTLIDSVPRQVRNERRTRLAALSASAHAEIPELVAADDVAGRISDYTFDIGEHHRAGEDTISRASALARAAGARTSRSSVHLHFSYDHATKASGVLAYLSARGTDPTRARARFAFIGDSQNDASCFGAFRTTIGVSNLRGTFSILPRYQTLGAEGAGFTELAERLVTLRR